MSPRFTRPLLFVVAPVALFALWAWKTGYLFPEPSLDPTPLARSRGEAVFKGRCYHCHEAIPIAPRVAGWTPEYAFDAIGHLPELRPAMPPFTGTEQERADLAVYLHLVGASVRPEELRELEEQAEGEWQPPRFEPSPGVPEPPQGGEPQRPAP